VSFEAVGATPFGMPLLVVVTEEALEVGGLVTVATASTIVLLATIAAIAAPGPRPTQLPVR
jgi:hypothetical protein